MIKKLLRIGAVSLLLLGFCLTSCKDEPKVATQVTVVFEKNDGSNEKVEKTGEPGQPMEVPTFTREGYEHTGFNPSIKEPAVFPQKNTTFRAQWKNNQKVVVTLTLPEKLEVQVGGTDIQIPYTVTPEDAQVSVAAPTSLGAVVPSIDTENKVITVKAYRDGDAKIRVVGTKSEHETFDQTFDILVVDPNMVTLTFDLNGGEGAPGVTYTGRYAIGTDFPTFKKPIWTGEGDMGFAGWEPKTPDKVNATDVNFKAKWEPGGEQENKKYNKTYDVMFANSDIESLSGETFQIKIDDAQFIKRVKFELVDDITFDTELFGGTSVTIKKGEHTGTVSMDDSLDETTIITSFSYTQDDINVEITFYIGLGYSSGEFNLTKGDQTIHIEFVDPTAFM